MNSLFSIWGLGIWFHSEILQMMLRMDRAEKSAFGSFAYTTDFDILDSACCDNTIALILRN